GPKSGVVSDVRGDGRDPSGVGGHGPRGVGVGRCGIRGSGYRQSPGERSIRGRVDGQRPKAASQRRAWTGHSAGYLKERELEISPAIVFWRGEISGIDVDLDA